MIVDVVSKLEIVFDAQCEDYIKAYKSTFWEGKSPALSGDFPISTDAPPSAKAFAERLTNFLKSQWKIDFIPHDLDNIDGDAEKGKAFLHMLLSAYADEIEDIQAEIGTTLRMIVNFLEAFAPNLDFLNEIAPDSYLRRPLDRIWQMEPTAIFGDMSIAGDSETDALLDAMEICFTPLVPEIASIADSIRWNWFGWYRAEDERDEMVFYETIERTITHIVACESRIVQTLWAYHNLDGDALLAAILDICRKGLECLGMFCGNYKFISGNRIFLESLVGVES